MGFTLDVRDLTVRKSGYTLLNSVTFSVASNEFVAIIGPNGAGKTTLLKAIAGERPYSGSVCINGENLYDAPEDWFREIGQVPIDNVLHERLPVATALGYTGILRNPNISEKRINGLLDEFGIGHKSNSPIYQLSSGERKRVNICAELLTDPGLLLLDEPTTNLDPDAERELMRKLAERAKQGTTTVAVSHTINSLDCCDRVIFMGNSEIVGFLKDEPSNWIWTPSKPGEIRAEISHADFSKWIIDKFKDCQTKARYPSRNPTKNSAPCGTSANDNLTFSSQVQRRNTAGIAWLHYLTILARQMKLLYYEGWRIPVRATWDRIKVETWGRMKHLFRETPSDQHKGNHKRNILDWNWMIPLPLFVALAFGPLTGLLLSAVLPDEALIQSTSKGISLDAGDASQAAFLIGLVAFLVGLLGSFREVVREINIYQHERLKGLQAKAYLLAKFTVLGVLYGMIAPILMFIVLGLNQSFLPTGLVLGGNGDVLLSLLLTSLAGAALGLAISCAGSSGEWATVLMGAAVIANALLSGLVKNEASEKLVDTLSIFVPSRWAMEGLKTTTELYCWGFNRILRDHYSPGHLLSVWTALVAYTLISLTIAYLALHRRDTWLEPLQRLKLLVSRGNYIYIVASMIIVIISFGLYRWSTQSHDAELFVARLEELRGLRWVVGQISAARCVEEQPPSGLDNAMPTPLPTEATPPRVENTPTASVGETPSPTGLPVSTPIATLEPTVTIKPSPTSPVPTEPTVVIPSPMDLYFGPTTQHARLASLPANSTLTLLSQATQNGTSWLRVQASGEAGHDYVGWVYAGDPPLSQHVWKVSLERKTPPDCAIPVASTYQKIIDLDLARGKLGTWASDGSGEVAVVVDLYRDDIGTLSDSLTLHLQLNDQDMRAIPIEPQRKRFLLQNGVYNVQVSSGDRLTLMLTPSSSNTLRTLHGHVSIFLIPQNCEFHER